MSERIKLKQGNSFLISGPASIYLCNGALLVIGKKVVANERFIVKKGRSTPVEVLEESIIEVKLGPDARIEQFEQVIPQNWKSSAEIILNSPCPTRALIIGDVDSGKTTFAVYLSNMAFDRGIRVAVVDADPGQAEISLPTTIGYGFLNEGIISMDKIPLESAYFIGSTSPSDAPARVVAGTRKLVDMAISKGAKLIIINTCGWIYGRRAREFKTSLIESICPEHLIAIQRGSEAEPLIKVWESREDTKILRISTSSASRVRSREERREKRETAYQKYFENSKERIFDLEKVTLMHSYYTYGKPLPRPLLEELQKKISTELIYGEIGDVFLFLVGREEPDPAKIDKLKELTSIEEIVFVKKGFEKGILVGLLNPKGSFSGLGVLSHIDYEGRRIAITTPADGDIGVIQIGQLKLDENWREFSKLPPYPI
ncbi:MAG: Clp1/GlmU family protein [Candidatus Methanomethyliaceae archaeon]|nr:Clp1/GlmU family protein [Candidatus Methanomethyliaceae archaeon]